MESDLKLEKNKSLKNFTSWQIGGAAEFYCAPENTLELKLAMKHAFSNNLTTTILGGGTNVLVSDSGIKGLVIHTHKLNKIKLRPSDGDTIIDCEPGAPKSEVLKIFLKLRLEPAIFLAGLPGDMAGGVVMNAGVGHKVHPSEFHEIMDSIEVLRCDNNGNIYENIFLKDEIAWEYRKSKNWQPGIISRVTVRWPTIEKSDVLERVREGNKRRKSTQPLSEPSCGSVFKNPQGDHAGRLIEESGLKGFSIGGAQVSLKHANFIVNKGNATALQTHQLIIHIQNVVEQKFNIKLTNEVVYLGDWS